MTQSSAIRLVTEAVLNAAVATLNGTITALSNAAVKLTGNQSIDGTKTFTSAPVFPDGSIPIASTSGTVPITRGGTGQTTANGIRSALGLGSDTTQPVPIANGGTAATTASAALNALGVTWGTAAPSGGSSGNVYLRYT